MKKPSRRIRFGLFVAAGFLSFYVFAFSHLRRTVAPSVVAWASFKSITNSSGCKCERSDESACTIEGVYGELDPNAVVTLIASPKSLFGNSRNSGGIRHLRHVFYSWKHLKEVNVIVASRHCPVILLARSAGLPTLQMTSGSDVSDLTYRSVLSFVDEVSPTSLCGYLNADIVFDETLVDTLKMLSKKKGFHPFMIVGTRQNVNIDEDQLVREDEDIDEVQWKRIYEIMMLKSKEFGPDAEDYFIFNRRGLGIKWREDLPPFLLGGRYFDNWFTSLIHRSDRVNLIDASATINAFHINHGTHSKGSHEGIASQLNAMLGKSYGFDKGTIDQAPLQTVKQNDILGVQLRKEDSSMKRAALQKLHSKNGRLQLTSQNNTST